MKPMHETNLNQATKPNPVGRVVSTLLIVVTLGVAGLAAGCSSMGDGSGGSGSSSTGGY